MGSSRLLYNTTMDGLAGTSSKAWMFAYSVEAFSDVSCAGNTLRETFKDINNVQWIVVLDSARGHAPPQWECWVCFPIPVRRDEFDRLMRCKTSTGPSDVFIGERDLLPIDLLVHCIDGSPYAQHNIPVDWKEIGENIPATVID